MPFKIVRNDITKVKADVIVNTANPNPICASGTDLAIYEAAGKEKLLAERANIGKIARGDIAVTGAYSLNAKYIIHTVGPVWTDGLHHEFEILEDCYRKSLQKALELKCESIAFPLISTGVYGFPKDKALQIAVSVFSQFLTENEIEIILVVFDKRSFQLSGQIVGDIDSYIDANYVKKSGSIIFLMGLATNVLGYRHPAAILDRSKNKCCGLITDGEELKNNQLCFSVDPTVLHLFSDLSRTCPHTSGGWVPPLALTPKNNRSVSFVVA